MQPDAGLPPGTMTLEEALAYQWRIYGRTDADSQIGWLQAQGIVNQHRNRILLSTAEHSPDYSVRVMALFQTLSRNLLPGRREQALTLVRETIPANAKGPIEQLLLAHAASQPDV